MSVLNLLVVDDEPDIRQLVATIARRAEPAPVVHLASDVEEALSILSRTPMDAMLTDIRMPGRSGVELLREVQARGLGMRCAIMTGYQDDLIEGVSISQLPVCAVLRKPFRLPELLDVIRQLHAPR